VGYLAGVLFLLRRLSLRPIWCAVGTGLAAQPYVLIGMSSGVVHSLLIPREFWLAPLPWLVAWFVSGRRDGWRMLGFYAALGGIYGFTYPLWAALFGLAFGLADAWRLWRGRCYADCVWLAAGGGLCALLVALPALTIARTMAGGESAVLDYNQITRAVYWTKEFRRLLIFAALGGWAFRYLSRRPGGLDEPTRRLAALLGASLGVCLIYEPFQRWVPTLSLLYLGRLSLVAYLVSMVAVAMWLHTGWREWKSGGRILAALGIMALLFDPVKHALRERRDPSPPSQPDFVSLCRAAQQVMPVPSLALVPPDFGCHYFRVYAERGLWISPKDTGVLSRTRALYREAQRRLELYNAFYADETPRDQRETLLHQFRTNGVTHLVTKTNDAWAASLSWPVVRSQGAWQLRAERPSPCPGPPYLSIPATAGSDGGRPKDGAQRLTRRTDASAPSCRKRRSSWCRARACSMRAPAHVPTRSSSIASTTSRAMCRAGFTSANTTSSAGWMPFRVRTPPMTPWC
jgi:hypothetical protein